jgi:hypothetical protein
MESSDTSSVDLALVVLPELLAVALVVLEAALSLAMFAAARGSVCMSSKSSAVWTGSRWLLLLSLFSMIV